MKIVLITNLYRDRKDQLSSENTQVVHFFAREWARQGHNVEVFVIWLYYLTIFNFSTEARKRRRYSFKESFTLDGVKVTRIPLQKLPRVLCSDRSLVAASELVIQSLGSRPDIVICHRVDPSAPVASEVAKRLGTKYLLVLHKSDLQNLENGRYFKKNAYIRSVENADGIAFRSEYLQLRFEKVFPDFDRPAAILKSGFSKSLIEKRDFLVEKSKRPIKKVVTACRLNRDKNVASLILAMKSFPELELEIVGDGPEMARLKLMARNNGIGDRIKFSGRLSNAETLSRMKKADIFAMPSTRETFGMVYLEAMSKGCITIGSRDQGIDGTIVDSWNGFLVKPGDTEELVGKISLIKNLSAPERERILLSALQTLEDMTEEKAASRYIAFVETVLQREGKGGK